MTAPWKRADSVPAAVAQLSPDARMYTKGACRVLLSRDQCGALKLRWHLSISCEDRYPTWDEIKDARYQLLPNNLTFALLLPPSSQYVNIHNNCFHLWEVHDD